MLGKHLDLTMWTPVTTHFGNIWKEKEKNFKPRFGYKSCWRTIGTLKILGYVVILKFLLWYIVSIQWFLKKTFFQTLRAGLGIRRVKEVHVRRDCKVYEGFMMRNRRPYIAACARTKTPPAQRFGLRGESDAILSPFSVDPKRGEKHV